MPKQKQNQYLVSVSFSTTAFGSVADMKQFLDHSEVETFLIIRGFSNDVATYIAKEMGMTDTRDLSYMSVEDVENILPDLTEEDKKHLSDIITWAQEHKRMIAYNCA
jgi:hypothetical protein